MLSPYMTPQQALDSQEDSHMAESNLEQEYRNAYREAVRGYKEHKDKDRQDKECKQVDKEFNRRRKAMKAKQKARKTPKIVFREHQGLMKGIINGRNALGVLQVLESARIPIRLNTITNNLEIRLNGETTVLGKKETDRLRDHIATYYIVALNDDRYYPAQWSFSEWKQTLQLLKDDCYKEIIPRKAPKDGVPILDAVDREMAMIDWNDNYTISDLHNTVAPNLPMVEFQKHIGYHYENGPHYKSAKRNGRRVVIPMIGKGQRV